MNPCMAHRGWSGKAPENTLAAIQLALDYPEISAIEVDVQLSKDGVPVLFHDFTLERTSNGTGYLKDFTYEQLRMLDVGSWFDSSFAQERIPTLAEALQLAKGRCRINIELKTAGDMYPEIAEKVVELVNKLEMSQEVYITSFDHAVIKRVHQLAPDITTGLIIFGKPNLLQEQLKEAGATILSLYYPYLSEEYLKSLTDAGMTVIAWTVDEPEHIETIMKWNPAVQICTNHPDRVFSLIKD